MRYARTLRIVGIAIILSLLMATVPAMPALALDYDVEIDPEEGAIGDEIEITGVDFGYSEETDRWVTIYFSEDEANKADNIDDEVENYEEVEGMLEIEEDDDGSFETTIEVPDELSDGEDDVEVTSGTYYIYFTVTSETADEISTYIRAVAEFEVIGGGDVSLDIDEGQVGSLVEITGEDFPTEEEISIEYDGDEVNIEDGDDETDDDGEFESIIYIPESYAGTHTITVIVGSSEVEAEFTVEPDILITPQSGDPGTEVTVSGTGFARRPKEVNIYFNNNNVAIAPLDTNGSFVAKFFVPEGLSSGSYVVEAEDQNLNSVTAPFNLTVPPPPEPTPEPTPAPEPTPGPTPPTPTPSPTSLSISHESGNIGTQIMMGGTGFEANGTITIKYDDEVMDTVTADDTGIFVATFKVPASQHGQHKITASDGTSTEELTFTVESVAPDIPEPLLPEMGVKVKSPVSFDWKDVTDESSPVTYTLQIATDDDFTADSIILEKTELTESQYTLSEKEVLELAGKETPYYWRVRAVDAASNEGEWTANNEFYVTGAINLPNWALYTLLGIGAVLIFGIGYWLGRRTAFYY